MDGSTETVADLLRRTDVPHEVLGDASHPVAGVRALALAGPDHLSLAYGEHVARLSETRASVLVTDADKETLATLPISPAVWIITAQPRRLVAEVAQAFLPDRPPGIHPTASVDPSAHVADTASVGPLATVGPDVEVGEDSAIESGAHILRGVVIGSNVRIGPGTVVGSEGFGYERTEEGWLKLPHLGTVIIEDDVEIGANTCVDRGTYSDTVIKRGAKVDNLVHVAHNVVIGESALVIAHAMLGGSAVIGRGSWIAPASALINGVRVGEDSMTGLGAVVLRDVEPGATVVGVPAKPLPRKDG